MNRFLVHFCIVLMYGAILMSQPNINSNTYQTAIFAGGCFWCMEKPFETLPGVISVISGYTGGTTTNPTYENYAQGNHVEVVQITFDPVEISYKQLLDTFWHQIDPTDPDGQFVDRGKQYRSAIFYLNPEQMKEAELSKQALQASGRFSKPIVTEIIPASTFYKAEDYHQDYYKNHSIKYAFYRSRSGRDEFLEKTWKENKLINSNNPYANYIKPSDKQLRAQLSPLSYKVTQKNGTEPAYSDPYWDLKDPGIYVDIVSGEPLFSSLDKFDSKTGWPSFTQPLEPNNVVEKEDKGWFTSRTEVRSKYADSHLGHVFADGPPPTGLRYCINSAALRFVPVAGLEQEGYGKYLPLFGKKL